MGELAGLLTAAGAVLSLLLGVVGLVMRRNNRDADAARAQGRVTEAILVANAQWRFKVRRLAADNGWDQHPDWPPLPVELTADYLTTHRTSDAPNNGTADALGELADIARSISGKGK